MAKAPLDLLISRKTKLSVFFVKQQLFEWGRKPRQLLDSSVQNTDSDTATPPPAVRDSAKPPKHPILLMLLLLKMETNCSNFTFSR